MGGSRCRAGRGAQALVRADALHLGDELSAAELAALGCVDGLRAAAAHRRCAQSINSEVCREPIEPQLGP